MKTAIVVIYLFMVLSDMALFAAAAWLISIGWSPLWLALAYFLGISNWSVGAKFVNQMTATAIFALPKPHEEKKEN